VAIQGGRMSTILDQALRDWPEGSEVLRVPMSLEEYLALPESTPWGDCPKVEWSKGVAIMIRPRPRHAMTQSALIVQLQMAFPEPYVLPGMGLAMGDDYRVPDIVIVDEVDPDVEYYTGVPLAVIEVLSPSTWREDLLDKAEEYANWGIPQFWLADPEVGEIIIRTNDGGKWRTSTKLNAGTPVVDVAIPGLGLITLRREQIFRYLKR